jgi:hypothetical protein
MAKLSLLAKLGSKAMNDINKEQPFRHADAIGNMPDPRGSGQVVNMMSPVEHQIGESEKVEEESFFASGYLLVAADLYHQQQ